MSGWRDIATAPKDGSFVDLWVMDYLRKQGERWPDCFWAQVQNRWRTAEGDDVEPYKFTEATHWMLPPEPPK